MPAPVVTAALIGGLGGLFGGASKAKQASKDRLMAAQQFAEQMKLANMNFGLSKRSQEFNERDTNRQWMSSQDDRSRGIQDQAALNPNRRNIMEMLMARFGAKQNPAMQRLQARATPPAPPTGGGY